MRITLEGGPFRRPHVVTKDAGPEDGFGIYINGHAVVGLDLFYTGLPLEGSSSERYLDDGVAKVIIGGWPDNADTWVRFHEIPVSALASDESDPPPPDPITELATEYHDWAVERRRISAQEATGDYPHPDRWAGSDDRAVELLEAAAKLLGWPEPTDDEIEDEDEDA